MNRMAEALGVGAAAYGAGEADRHRPSDMLALAVKLERMTGVPRGWFLGSEPSDYRSVVGPAGIEPTTSTV